MLRLFLCNAQFFLDQWQVIAAATLRRRRKVGVKDTGGRLCATRQLYRDQNPKLNPPLDEPLEPNDGVSGPLGESGDSSIG